MMVEEAITAVLDGRSIPQGRWQGLSRGWRLDLSTLERDPSRYDADISNHK
jgi:hypothetical protein